MIAQRARPRVISGALAMCGVVAAGFVAAVSIVRLSGTKTGAALAVAAIAGPPLLYLAVVAPLVFPFGLYVFAVPFDNILDLTSFGTLTKLLAIASGAAIVFYLLRTRRALPPPRALFFWCALYLWAAVTAFWAIDQRSVFVALATSLELVALYAAISVLPADRGSIRWISAFTVAGGMAAAVYGAYLFHNGLDLYYGGRLRITTDTGAIDPNHFAAALLLPVALCLNASLTARKLWVMLLGLGALGVLAVGVALSESRGALLALAAMFVYVLVRTQRRARLIWFALLAIALGAAFGPHTRLLDRFGDAVSSGGAGRTSIWRVGLVALKSHWLFGAGYANFPFAYDRAFLQTPHQIAAMSTWHRAAHDLVLGTSVELGVVGLALLLAAWISQFLMLRVVDPSSEDYPLRVALEATIIGTFVAALFLDVMIFKHVWLTFMFAALLRNAHFHRRERQA